MKAPLARAAALAGCAAVVAGCATEQMPPVVTVHHPSGAQVHRAAIVPTDCDTSTIPQAPQGYWGLVNGVYGWQTTPSTDPVGECHMLHEIVLAELEHRGAQVVDLARVNIEERQRTTEITSPGVWVTVKGTTLADADVWTQRAWLAELGVDAIVRVRTVELPAKPKRTLAVVRVTRPADASLVWSSSCEMEHGELVDAPIAAEYAVRCALRAGMP